MIWTVAGVGCDEIVRANPRGRSYSRWHGFGATESPAINSSTVFISLIRLSDSLCTYSEVRCQRCHRELTAFADLGVVVGIDMNKKRSKEEVDRLEMYMSHLVGVLRDTEE